MKSSYIRLSSPPPLLLQDSSLWDIILSFVLQQTHLSLHLENLKELKKRRLSHQRSLSFAHIVATRVLIQYACVSPNSNHAGQESSGRLVNSHLEGP